MQPQQERFTFQSCRARLAHTLAANYTRSEILFRLAILGAQPAPGALLTTSDLGLAYMIAWLLLPPVRTQADRGV